MAPTGTSIPVSSEGSNFGLPSFNLGNGLVDLGPLTTLVGSSLAESLILGNRGPAGLSWGAMSAFGTLSVVKACLGGAIPSWLKVTLGLRTAELDKAIGMHLSLSRTATTQRKARFMAGSPIGIGFKHGSPLKVSSLSEL